MAEEQRQSIGEKEKKRFTRWRRSSCFRGSLLGRLALFRGFSSVHPETKRGPPRHFASPSPLFPTSRAISKHTCLRGVDSGATDRTRVNGGTFWIHAAPTKRHLKFLHSHEKRKPCRSGDVGGGRGGGTEGINGVCTLDKVPLYGAV